MIRWQAPEINTILGLQAADKGVALTFTPDEQGEKVAVANPFNGKDASAQITLPPLATVYFMFDADQTTRKRCV